MAAILESGANKYWRKQMSETNEVRPFSVFNQSTNKEGGIDRCAIVDKDGMIKELIGLDEQTQTSIQMFDPGAGDTLLKTNSLNKELEVMCADAKNKGKTLSELVSKEHYDLVNVFLQFEFPDNGFFIVAGVNDTIYGRSMEETFRRREQLADLFKGLDEKLLKLFVNWIDKCDPANMKMLRWDGNEKNLSEFSGNIRVKHNAHLIKGEDEKFKLTQRYTSAIIWYDTPDEQGNTATYYAVNKNPKELLEAGLEGNFSIEHLIPVTDKVQKVIQIIQENDELKLIEAFSRNGIPKGAYIRNWYKHFNIDHGVDNINPLFKLFDLNYTANDTSFNDPYFEYDKPFSLVDSLSNHKFKYTRTVYLNDKGKVLEYNLNQEQPIEEDFYSKPHIHVFSNTDYEGDEFIFVNCKVLLTETQGENKNGNSTKLSKD